MPTLYPNNMLYYSDNMSSNPHDLPSVGASESAQQQGFLTNLLASRLGEHAYERNEMMFMQQNIEGELPRNPVPMMMQGQGLSLSLSTQIQASIPVSAFQYRQPSSEASFMGAPHQMNADSEDKRLGAIPNSKYLKAAQQLLDEVVNVRKALKQKSDKSQSMNNNGSMSGKDSDGGSKGGDGAMGSNAQESTNSASEISAAERQDLQNKMTKLLSMMDEVDRRYKQYYHQMQIVVSSFDVIAGNGAAKPYTALALQTISRHFRCLRDAITGQIRATRRSLGEQDSQNGSPGVGISRLRYIDQHLRQQRAFQQLGMVQQHAWRPQRGLPESSVTILRAWLFEHFLHPYPKDSEKLMLARQTGLTRSQVSNWFINARVRLWKPMVEEMYKEETSDTTPTATEIDSNSSSDNNNNNNNANNSQRAQDDKRSSEDYWVDQHCMKSTDDHDMDQTKAVFHDERSSECEDANGLLHDALVQPNAGYWFRNNGGGGVSLTLGLQHCDAGGGSHELYEPVPGVGAEATDYDSLNLVNRRHRFGPAQLLHDFVA
ncbi:BEL1-like homeodomain protein 7 [Acorus gramineus]|uniref:BEL1-like homeodomain protein 7 n=1 Tax=Acorus gramineus TaxID=55184 RepID=A0AAV9AFF3_ACOGR|nr:BEL1-like homeodomain protein 7 [Acorus gramineus]